MCSEGVWLLVAVQHVYSSNGLRLLHVQIRMAPDNLTAYILWDAFPQMADAAEREIWQRCSKPPLQQCMQRPADLLTLLSR